MTLLDRAAILGADDLKHEDVEIPEWGGTIRVRSMTGAERDEVRASVGDSKELSLLYAALLAATLVDETGARLFTATDIAALQAKSARTLDAAAEVAKRLNGFSAGVVEDAEKNLEPAPSDSSGSA